MTLTIGPLQSLLNDDRVREIMVVNGSQVWVENDLGLRHVCDITGAELETVIEAITRASGRRVDTLSPILDAPLADGSRACVVIPPVARHGATVSIRKFTQRVLPLAAFGTEPQCEEIRELVMSRRNVVISGATAAGKTSLLSAVTQWFSRHDRIVCLEDTAEIRCNQPHFVSLQTRPANQEGMGRIDLHDLVRTALRLRPDRLIVGEVRGAEAIDMLLALGSGHVGSWSTLHASSAADTVERLVALLLRHHPGWSTHDAERLVTGAVHAVVHVARLPTGRRSITAIEHLDPRR